VCQRKQLLGRGKTYVGAIVAVAGNVRLSATQVNARVDVRLAPRRAFIRGDRGGGHGTARNGRVERGVALGRREANERRGGDDESRVEHS
jgi:hypothetical protein